VTQIENQMSATMTQRRLLLGTSRDTISFSLLVAMTAWLLIVFAVFGVIAPRNMVVYATIVLCALSFSSAIFFILNSTRRSMDSSRCQANRSATLSGISTPPSP
jgi:hypothetical protein